MRLLNFILTKIKYNLKLSAIKGKTDKNPSQVCSLVHNNNTPMLVSQF